MIKTLQSRLNRTALDGMLVYSTLAGFPVNTSGLCYTPGWSGEKHCECEVS